MSNIIIFGGKGNGTVILACLLDMIYNYGKSYNIIGFVNNNHEKILEIDGYPVLGDINEIKELCFAHEAKFIPAIASSRTMNILYEIFELRYPELDDLLISIIHPSNFIGYNVEIGKGVFIGPQSYIGQNCVVENLCFIHSQCYIARDCVLKKFSYLAPKVYLGAEVVVNKAAYLGINSIVKERVRINSNSIVGMGSVVVQDIEENAIYFGEKAKRRD